VVLARPGGKPSLRGHGRDAAQHGLVLVLQLHDEELAVHRGALEFVLVRQHEVCVELQTALAETTEDADRLFLGEECHSYLLADASTFRMNSSSTDPSGTSPRTALKTSS